MTRTAVAVARAAGVLLVAIGLTGCFRVNWVRKPFEIRRADPAAREVVIALWVSDCTKTRIQVRETDAVVFVSASYRATLDGECPGTQRVEERVVRLTAPLGTRRIVDGIPPEPTAAPSSVDG